MLITWRQEDQKFSIILSYTEFQASLSQKYKLEGTEEVTQSVRCLLCKPGDLTLDSKHLQKKLGMAACAWNLSAGQSERGGSMGFASQVL